MHSSTCLASQSAETLVECAENSELLPNMLCACQVEHVGIKNKSGFPEYPGIGFQDFESFMNFSGISHGLLPWIIIGISCVGPVPPFRAPEALIVLGG